jgi:diaminopimelate decarboxylase
MITSQVMAGVDVENLANTYQTPLVVYSESQLLQNVVALKNTIPAGAELIYSLKANPNPTLMQILADQGLIIDVASTGELVHALQYGISPKQIIFGGPGKSPEGIKIALEAGILAFNVESKQELLLLRKYSKLLHTKTQVMIRVNPQLTAAEAILRMGGVASPFGIEEEDLDEAIELCSPDLVEYAGLFVYAGSQYLKAEDIAANAGYLLKVIADRSLTNQTHQLPITMLDFGGGFGVPESDEQPGLDLDRLHQELKLLFNELPPNLQATLQQIFFESGRFVTASAGVFVTTVMDIKISRGKKFVIVDGGNNNLGVKQPQYRVFEPSIWIAGRKAEIPAEELTIVGSTCTPLDVVHKGIKLPEVRIGDRLVIDYCGAYLLSFSPLNFCGHPVPAEVLIRTDGESLLIRERGKLTEACGVGFTAEIIRDHLDENDSDRVNQD